MDKQYLVTGIKSGLGKYLYENLPSCAGMDRHHSINLFKDEDFDTIVHCAFNKESKITDYYKYLEDNLHLTESLLTLSYKKFIYISTVDVYADQPSYYGLFKKFAESIVQRSPNTLILRCSMILGKGTKPNHITKLIDNVDKLTLSEQSTFNYILNSHILQFVEQYASIHKKGIIDFISNKNISLKEAKEEIKSTTQLGDYIYTSDYPYINPVYKLHKAFDNSSLDNLKSYIND